MKQKSSLKDRLVGSRYFSFGITLSLFVLLYVVGMMNYRGFMKPQVFCNLLIDNAALIIATIGITFVLLIGGIDISIGSVVALTCMSSAQMLQNTGLPAPTVILIVLAMGAVFGLVQGWLIAEFNMQPFIVTLAGQFFARGMTAIISRETIVIDNPVYTSLASARIYVLPGGFISVGVVIALVTLVAATLVLKFTRFGRNIYALGGNEMSAQLMGLPTKRTKILAYVVCGFCAGRCGLLPHHALRVSPPRRQHGDGRHRLLRDRRHADVRRRGLPARHPSRRADPGCDPNLHHLPGDALRLVDAHHHRPAAVPVHCDPGGGQPQPAAPQL